jgi:hypothetical protein
MKFSFRSFAFVLAAWHGCATAEAPSTASTAASPEVEPASSPEASDTPNTPDTPEKAEVPSLDFSWGIGPIALGMTLAQLKATGLAIHAGEPLEVGPYVVVMRDGKVASIQVSLADLPTGLDIGGTIYRGDHTGVTELADAVGNCDRANLGAKGGITPCHEGKIEISAFRGRLGVRLNGRVGEPPLVDFAKGVGPIAFGMTRAELEKTGLTVEDAGNDRLRVGSYDVTLSDGRVATITVTLGDFANGLRLGPKIYRNESTPMHALADAVGACDPIPPNIGSARTSCHGGAVVIDGAGPVGGRLSLRLLRPVRQTR